MDIFTLLSTSLICVAAIFYLFRNRKRKNYPPGPPGYPVIGHMLHLSPEQILSPQLTKYAKEYGPIYALKLGKYRVIVLSDANLIREAFSDPLFNGRPDNKVFRSLAHGAYGILSIDGRNWMEQRKFTLRHLRDFGYGKNQMENLIVEEVKLLVDNFKAQEGNSIELSRRFNLAVVNSLWTIMTGARLEHDDPHLNQVLGNIFKVLNEVFCQSVLSFVPELATLFPKRSGWNSLVGAVNAATKYFNGIIAEHEKTFTEGEPRDFIDAYLIEIYKTKDKESNFYKENGHMNLVSIMLDLFAAGAETTSATLNWSILYLTSFPEVQKKLQEEIDHVVGQARLPSLSDKPKMPYTEAVMLEVLRLSSIADLGLFHVTLEDTKLGGYDIPKDTFVLGNFWMVHRDPKHWTNPEEFNPDRFLSEDKKTVVKKECLTPFSVGRRVCLGEGLAKDQFFLFLATIFQRFDVRLDPERPQPSLEPQNTFILKPQLYHVVMHDRSRS